MKEKCVKFLRSYPSPLQMWRYTFYVQIANSVINKNWSFLREWRKTSFFKNWDMHDI